VAISQVTDQTGKPTQHHPEREDLQASEIRCRRLFKSARYGILIIDAAIRKITDFEPLMWELMAYSRDEFLDVAPKRRRIVTERGRRESCTILPGHITTCHAGMPA
jgi:PAS domain-containing protein